MQGAASRGRPAFRLKGSMPALTTLCLLTEDLDAVERQLVDQLSQMPQFFLNAPVLVDLEALGESALDLGLLAGLLRRHQLVPVAVKNPTEVQRQRAVEAGWGVLQNTAGSRGSGAVETHSPWPPPVSERAPRPSSAPAPRSAPRAQERELAGLTVRTPVRSGQVVYAAGSDLVVLAPVSSGAELIADGHIHVYAPLRGRALAGAHDNPDASIFCMSLEAEFLSINGYYLMAEEIPKEHRGKPARVYLEGEQLAVARL